MDATVHTLSRRADSALHAVATTDAARTLTVRAEYRLSQAGRKAALLNGRSGRAIQRIKVTLPATRLHLVHVDVNGLARLKLRPQYKLNAQQQVVRIDARPTYDYPPAVDELLQDAARNHEMERAFFAQHTTVQITRREANANWLDEIARAFLNDPAQRAVIRPAPTARRCQLVTARGSMHFDARRDVGLARRVPLEAFRRYQNDLRIRNGQAAFQREHDVVVDADRQTMMREWVEAHGTIEQRERLSAGLFPKSEWVAAVASSAFAPLGFLPVYDAIGPRFLERFLRQHADYHTAVVSREEFRVSTRALPGATPVQWELIRQVRAAMPDAGVLLLERELAWTRDPHAPRHRAVTVLVTVRIGPLRLRREYYVPQTAPSFSMPVKEAECVKA
jgi:hypothetical protein